MQRWLTVIACLLLALCASIEARAADDALDAGVIRQLPRTLDAVIAAHQRSENDACQPIDGGEPIETPQLDQRIAYRIEDASPTGTAAQRVVDFDVSRRSVLAAGADMQPADQNDLPLLSGGKILECVNDYYIIVQVRVHRRSPDGIPHLFYRPYGAVASYRDPKRTQDFVDLARNSVREFRSVGLYVKPSQAATATTLRTLVLINRNMVVPHDGSGSPQTARPNYEFMFVRARDDESAPAGLALHAFISTEQRQRLHYLGKYETPTSVDDCAIKTTIVFTEYGFASVMPKARVSRRTAVNSERSFTLAELNQFAEFEGWQGDALDNLSETLDAMIDGSLSMANR